MHINHISQKEYQGRNADALEEFRLSSGFKSHEWVTFLQAKQVGRQVKKGVHGCRIVKIVEDADSYTRAIRNYTVFNLEQTEPIPVLA